MSIVSALIGAGSSLIGNIFGASSQNSANKNNLKINQMNNEFNQRMMQKQMDYNTMMWNKQNAYNDPSAQRERLEAAGLNPYMMLNGGNAGIAQAAGGTSAASAAGAAPQQAYHPDFSGIPQAILMAKQGRNIDADTDIKTIDSQTLHARNQKILANLAADVDNKKLQYKLNDVLLSNADAMQKAQIRQMNEQSEKTIVERMLLDADLKAYPENLRLDLAQKSANLLLTRSQRNLTLQQIKTEMEQTVKTSLEANGIKINNENLQKMSKYILIKAANEAMRSGEPQNIWQGIADGSKGFNKFAEDYIGKPVSDWWNKNISKPSKRLWKDTKRYTGLNHLLK